MAAKAPNIRRASRGRRYRAPSLHGLRTEGAQRAAGDQVSLDVEGVVGGGVHRQDSAGPQALLVARRQARLDEGGAIGPQLVVADLRGSEALLLSSLRISLRAANLSRRRCTRTSSTSPSLSTARQRYISIADAHRHLVKVHSVDGLRASLPEAPGDGRPELQHPTTDRLVPDVEPASAGRSSTSRKLR